MNRVSKPTAIKSTAKAAQAEKVEDVKPVIADSSIFDDVMKRYADAQAALLEFFQAPSWKRTLVAVVTYIAGCIGVSLIAGALVDMVMVGAVALGASVFLGLIVAAIGAILVVWYGHKCVMRVAGAVLTGEADERAVAAYDATKRMLSKLNPFGRRSVEAVA